MPDAAPHALTRRLPLVVTGVSGSGKSTIGARAADALGLRFIDGDALHPPENIARMSSGVQLTDDERWPWLDRIGAVLGDDENHPKGLVLACSALRRTYRDRLRVAEPNACFAFLDATPEATTRRLEARHGHFMPASLVASQFAALERPTDEPDVVVVPARSTLDESIKRILAFARLAAAR